MAKEHIQPNHVAPTLFVGVGGIGSSIIKKVGDLCINDDVDSVRFVVLDTDVNDLEKVEKGIKVRTVQTSSPRSVGDYLEDDKSAKEDWFPVNNIISEKTVSEGAGQVRAISRLAFNATIKNGNINVLYKAIDELFLKDGASKSQAIKVVIASTTAGGTGSGIAMLAGMQIRHYLKKFYPEAAAIIRGYFVLPGVMDTVIENESEKESLRRNGYATIKEINAFMMQGSGFFESERKLHRYKGLHITIPTTNGGREKLNNLPFDFCFLLDRIDKNQKSMMSLDQYKSYAARTLYEQNIGSMRFSASSKEDNVVREFTNPAKLGRCRFGGAGAAVIRYPYETICDYIALDWTQKLLFGNVSDEMSDEDKEDLVNSTWRQYDADFEKKLKEYESSGIGDEPHRADVYIEKLENGTDKFGDMLFNKYLRRKVDTEEMPVESRSGLSIAAEELVSNYLTSITDAANANKVFPKLDPTGAKKNAQNASTFKARYNAIQTLERAADVGQIVAVSESFAHGVFESKLAVDDENAEDYTLQGFLSCEKKALHPNATRYLLYKLYKALDEEKADIDTSSFEKRIAEAKGIATGENASQKNFDVKGDFKKQTTLEDMCGACDEMGKLEDILNKSDDPRVRCNTFLADYLKLVTKMYEYVISKTIIKIGKAYVARLIEEYEHFYSSFKEKATGILKEKDFVADSIRFANGDCVLNLFNTREMLDMLAERMKNSSGGDAAERDMFAKIHGLVLENAEIKAQMKYDRFIEESPHDIFDEVMVGYHRELVVRNKGEELDIDVLHAMKLEYQVKCDVDKLYASEEEKIAIAKNAKDSTSIKTHIIKMINKGKNLASVGLCRKSFDEARDVNAMAYSNTIKDGGGIRVGDFFSEKEATPTVSRYEVHFFRSEYNIMPTEIFQFSAPKIDCDEPQIELLNDENKKTSGESFRRYHNYMENIGPDSRMNSNITPHIDTRWNSISVMPEIDLDYQDHLMKHIHKALFYGFTFGIIERHCPSKYDPEKYEYRYLDGKNGYKKLIVSNGTKCDSLYEVLDALYFDRAAVRSIHNQVTLLREADERNSVDYEKTLFKQKIQKFTRTNWIGDDFDKNEKDAAAEAKTSVFELVMLYYNSLPPRIRDASEIEIMVDAIIEAIQVEVSVFTSEDDSNPLLGKLIAQHYNLLSENYNKMPELLGKGVEKESNDVLMSIKKKVEEKLVKLNVTMPKLN